MNFFCYKIINLANWKIYIGITTCKSIEKRFKRHISTSKNKNSEGYDMLICRAIRKYGENNFKVSLIKECDSVEELKKSEIKYIKFFDSKNKKYGYNNTNGGDGAFGYKHTEASKAKMKGRKISDAHKQIVSNSRKKKIPEAQLKEIERLYFEEKLTCKEIAAKLNFEIGFIDRRIIEFKKDKNMPPAWASRNETKESRDKIKLIENNAKEIERLYFEEKLSGLKIAEKLGTTPTLTAKKIRELKAARGIFVGRKGSKNTSKRKFKARVIITDEQLNQIEYMYFTQNLSGKKISELINFTEGFIHKKIREIKSKKNILLNNGRKCNYPKRIGNGKRKKKLT